MFGAGMNEFLAFAIAIFLLILAVMIILMPFFIFRIRNEIISINKKITEYIEDQKRREYTKAG